MNGTITQEEVETWARTLYGDAVDHKDAAGFAAVFAEEATLRFANNEPIRGRGEIEAAIAQFFQVMVWLKHDFIAISCVANKAFLEAMVTYERQDGGVVTVPAMTVFELTKTAGGLAAESCRIYVDLMPLFAA